MRKLNLIFAMIVTSGIMMSTSCKKEEVEPTPTPTPTAEPNPANSFYAKVDGVEHKENLLYANESNGAGILITGSENGGFPSLGLSIPNDVAVGTYDFDGAFGDYRGIYNVGKEFSDIYSAAPGAGKVTIKTHNTTTDFIEGTFSFTATPAMGNSSTNSYEITEGSFSMSY